MSVYTRVMTELNGTHLLFDIQTRHIVRIGFYLVISIVKNTLHLRWNF